MLGINLSGAEFGNIGGQYGWSYIYPSAGDLDYYVKRGVELVRLPVRWERLQPTAGGDLDPAEVGRLNKFLADAKAADVKVIVDIHNFGAYNGANLGTAGATTAQFADFWKKLATAIGTQPALTGYDLMNEPHDLPSGVWPAAAQAAVDAIRTVDTAHSIYVEGEAWGSSINWSQTNAGLDIKDPANKIVYEAHIYFDRYTSGTYQGSYDSEGAYPDIGADRIADFVNWLADKNAKGFIGEFAVPNNDPRWLTVLDKFAAAMDAAHLDGTYWGAGPWWGDYPLALRTAAGDPNPQLGVLEKYFKAAPVPDVPAETILTFADTGPDIYVDGPSVSIPAVTPETAAATPTTVATPVTVAPVTVTPVTTDVSPGVAVSRADRDDILRDVSEVAGARVLKKALPIVSVVDTHDLPAAAVAVTVAAPAVSVVTGDAAHQSVVPAVSTVAVSKVAEIAAPVVQAATVASVVSETVVRTTAGGVLSKAAAKAAAAAAETQAKLAAAHAVVSDAVASVEHLDPSAVAKAAAPVVQPALVASAAVAVAPAYAVSTIDTAHGSILGGDIDDHGLFGLGMTLAHHATSLHVLDVM